MKVCNSQGPFSNLYLVPNKGGGPRHDKSKTFQPVSEIRTFQNGGSTYATRYVKKRDFLVKFHLKDAYFTVPIWEKHQKFLRFICVPNRKFLLLFYRIIENFWTLNTGS